MKIINHILNILMTLLLIALTTSIILSSTILNKNYIINTLDKTNYYEDTYQLVKKHFNSQIIQLRIENNIIDNIFKKEDIKKDINNIINSIYNNKEYKINKNNIKNKLDNNINILLKNNNITLTKEEQKEINKLETIIINNYETDIIYSNKVINTTKKYLPKITKLLKIFTITICITSLILIIINSLLQKKLTILPFLSSGIIFIFIKILINNKYKNILILSKPFTNTLKYIINNISNIYLITGIILTLLSIIIIYHNNKGA